MRNVIHLIILTITLLSVLIHKNSAASENITLDAHVHGLSEMTIAIDKQTLEIEIKSPAINLVGFEHRAKTKEEIATVKKVELQLNNHDAIFSFSGGHCELLNQAIDVSSISTTHHHIEKEHKHAHVTNQPLESHRIKINHSEVVANYRYHCEKTAELSAITVAVFALFPGIEQIQAMWITELFQGTKKLTVNSNILKLRD